jgi:hypothetical protein
MELKRIKGQEVPQRGALPSICRTSKADIHTQQISALRKLACTLHAFCKAVTFRLCFGFCRLHSQLACSQLYCAFGQPSCCLSRLFRRRHPCAHLDPVLGSCGGWQKFRRVCIPDVFCSRSSFYSFRLGIHEIVCQSSLSRNHNGRIKSGAIDRLHRWL